MDSHHESWIHESLTNSPDGMSNFGSRQNFPISYFFWCLVLVLLEGNKNFFSLTSIWVGLKFHMWQWHLRLLVGAIFFPAILIKWYIAIVYGVISSIIRLFVKETSSSQDSDKNILRNENEEPVYQTLTEGHLILIPKVNYTEENKDKHYVITSKRLRKFVDRGKRDSMLKYGVLAIRQKFPPLLCIYSDESLKDKPDKPSICLNLLHFTVDNPIRFNRQNPLLLRHRQNLDNSYYIFAPSGFELERWWIHLADIELEGKAREYKRRDPGREYWARFLTMYLVFLQLGQLQLIKHRGKISNDLKDDHQDSRGKLNTLRKFRLNLARRPHPASDGWLNIIIGRIWLMVKEKQQAHNYLADKIAAKLSCSKFPSFINDVRLKKFELGDFPPMFHDWVIVETAYNKVELVATMEYRGAASIHFEAEFSLDKKSMRIPIALAVIFTEIIGKIAFRFNPFPSDNLWWGFLSSPALNLSVVPLVADAKIGFGVIKELVENRIKGILDETIVWPNMANLCILRE